MIQPVNGHLLIEPVVIEGFIASSTDKYQEIGIVKCISFETIGAPVAPKVGDKVFFDAWLAKKYPVPDGKAGEYWWLVKWEDVTAIEHHVEQKQVSELDLSQ